MNNHIKKYAVVGHPIHHSKSPAIHQCFADEFGLNIMYEKIDINPEHFVDKIHVLRNQNYLGLNITLPFKADAFAMCDEVTATSRMTGSVNTLTFIDGKIYGDTTDGIGIVRDLDAKHIVIKDTHLAILGAGGASNGVMFDVINAGPKSITLANRTKTKADDMVNKWYSFAKGNGVELRVIELHAFNGQGYHLVINGTSSALLDGSSPIADHLFQSETVYYDMIYGVETRFMLNAKHKGAQYFDGLGMLIGQAAASFTIWHKLEPNLHLAAKALEVGL
ncbi:shikimate dehydrogenase [Methylophilaceae bacterium]|nr:shikimate dehydrogenase [Methylophilaceae bacterium]